MSNIDDAKILGTAVQNLVVRVTLSPGFVHPFSNDGAEHKLSEMPSG
jgi:hypothetical protein